MTSPNTGRRPRMSPLLIVALLAHSLGCAALTNPVADGIPVRRVPEEVLGRPKAELIPLPLNLLRQQPPEVYRLDSGDVLAIVADEILTRENQAIPVRLPDVENPTAAVGVPVPVNEDGTITLPKLAPIPVAGLTVQEAEKLVKDYATGLVGGVELVKPGATRITVQLLQKRSVRVIVIREDVQLSNTALSLRPGVTAQLGVEKRGGGVTVRLPAYENDVLRALNLAGGPPGLEAKNEVIVIRGDYDPDKPEQNITRIPLRVYPDEPVNIRPDDILLNEGDIVYIESRESQVYYTAGLMGAGQFLLPRDYDLRVIEAIAQIRGPLINGGFTQNAFVAQAVNVGLGNPSPSLCTVIRELPGGHKFPIRVDLNVAFRDQRENIIIQPGDMIVLQERPGEAIGRYLSQQFRFNTAVNTIRQNSMNQTLNGVNP